VPLAGYVALVHRRQLALFAASAALPFAFQLWYNVTYLESFFWTQIPLGSRYWRGQAKNTARAPRQPVAWVVRLFSRFRLFAGRYRSCVPQRGDGVVRAIALARCSFWAYTAMVGMVGWRFTGRACSPISRRSSPT
jgi:hypothetical protein